MRKGTKFRVLFKAISLIIFLTLLYNSAFDQKLNFNFGGVFHQVGTKHGRNLEEINEIPSNYSNISSLEHQICAQVFEHKGYATSCEYVMAHPECTPSGYFNYIKFFYCDCKKFPFFGYLILASWLAVLFYMLGNTAADYFCCSLEKLSDLLRMSPTVSGVTLLPFGNGAPDVFASIAAFMGRGSSDMGLNSVLGGVVFVTCVVVGVVSLNVSNKRVQINKNCFIRDLCFFLFTIVCLALILIRGKVSIWGAMAFVSIYVVYALFVAINEIMRKKRLESEGLAPLLPVAGSFFSSCGGDGDDESKCAPLLKSENPNRSLEDSSKLPHWIWNTNVAIFSDFVKPNRDDKPRPWGWNDDDGIAYEDRLCTFSKVCLLFEITLNIPRRLTIPIVEEDRWSKIYAIATAFLAPVLLAILWNTQRNLDPLSGQIGYVVGLFLGFGLSVPALLYTSPDHPPRNFLFPWVVGGFFMSIIWFYIIANELVSLLISLGIIFGVNPSFLALTMLAWGNSMGDLISNTALAMNDKNGVQIAMSGCYAGPMFNTLIGLGVSFVLGAWSKGSEPYSIAPDGGLFVTLGFLALGLVWALVVLPRNDMYPNKVLGAGLIVIYVVFLALQIIMTVVLGAWSV